MLSHDGGAFEYSLASGTFRSVAAQQLGQAGTAYGVYIVRELNDAEILYIGKGGTIGRDGSHLQQDLLKRLTNTPGRLRHTG